MATRGRVVKRKKMLIEALKTKSQNVNNSKNQSNNNSVSQSISNVVSTTNHNFQLQKLEKSLEGKKEFRYFSYLQFLFLMKLFFFVD